MPLTYMFSYPALLLAAGSMACLCSLEALRDERRPLVIVTTLCWAIPLIFISATKHHPAWDLIAAVMAGVGFSLFLREEAPLLLNLLLPLTLAAVALHDAAAAFHNPSPLRLMFYGFGWLRGWAIASSIGAASIAILIWAACHLRRDWVLLVGAIVLYGNWIWSTVAPSTIAALVLGWVSAKAPFSVHASTLMLGLVPIVVFQDLFLQAAYVRLALLGSYPDLIIVLLSPLLWLHGAILRVGLERFSPRENMTRLMADFKR